jgi:hypothetical protein
VCGWVGWWVWVGVRLCACMRACIGICASYAFVHLNACVRWPTFCLISQACAVSLRQSFKSHRSIFLRCSHCRPESRLRGDSAQV